MKKDHLREYCTEAYRFYAKSGGVKGYLDKLFIDYCRNNPPVGASSSVEGTLIKKENILREHAAEFADLEAVEKTLYLLGYCLNSGKIIKCIEMIYFKDCWKDIEMGYIPERVHEAELQLPASRRQIYIWLKQARELFAKERGLRL